ncbi:GRP family sugar transporter [Bdellovibrionota bacterium FG-1]
MFILNSYAMAVLFCVITMLCWGSWANTQKLAAKNWRFELFYWDYSFGVLLLALGLAATLGSNGIEGRPFLADMEQAGRSNIGSAFIGGVIFNIANILLVAAISIAGMAVAFPVGIGIALALGVIINYVATPVGNPLLLLGGVALVGLAILIDAKAYSRLVKQRAQVPTKGIVLSIVSGILMGLFYRFVASSMASNFAAPEIGKLGPYSAVVFFCVGIFLSGFILNPIMMRKPFQGPPVKLSDYMNGSLFNHFTGILGGMIWCIGMSFSILASERAGFAISYGLGQGATMVAAVWGIFFWREFKDAPAGTNRLLALMMLAYFAGLTLIILARTL